MDAMRTLKANLKLQNQPCGWCKQPLQLGEDAAVCNGCEQCHHHRCWESNAGCARQGCANAPLPKLAPQAMPPVQQMGHGMMMCPNCRAQIPAGSLVCSYCRAITSPDGIYHGPKMNAPGAVASLVWALVGLFICGIILGPVAISQSNKAKRAMAVDPTLGGQGLATAGLVIGIIATIGHALILFINLGTMGGRH
jgi:uncharacterized protein DUF4190/RING finger family protein